MKIFPTAAVKRIDAYTIENEPISSIMLMERAAAALTRAILGRYPQGAFAVFAGQGNNGGDALAVARMLAVAGHAVDVWVVAPTERLSPDCAANLQSLQAMAAGGLFSLALHNAGSSFAPPQIEAGTVVVDGLFGSGLTRPVEGLYATVINFINSLPNEVVAIDIPSGLMGEDNSCNNYSNIVKATVTYTLQFPKLSMLFAENAPYVGEFETLDISLSKEAMDKEPTPYSITTAATMEPLLPRRSKHAHKGCFGRALLVAGSEGMAGASVLAARAALRSGVGLLTLCVPRCNNTIVQRSVPEAMTILSSTESYISTMPATDKYTAVAVGPGLGQAQATEEALLALIDSCRVPMVVDADALNLIAAHAGERWLALRADAPSACVLPSLILTPHPGELSRLTGQPAGDCLADLIGTASRFAQTHGVTVNAKNARSVITDGRRAYINPTGNSALAKGGSGDVLSGITATLAAQGCDALTAAVLAAYLH